MKKQRLTAAKPEEVRNERGYTYHRPQQRHRSLKAGRSITKIYVASGNETKPLQRIRDLAAKEDILVEETP